MNSLSNHLLQDTYLPEKREEKTGHKTINERSWIKHPH